MTFSLLFEERLGQGVLLLEVLLQLQHILIEND